MSRFPSLAIIIVLLATGGGAADPARARELQDLRLVESPTAGILGHGAYLFEGRVGPSNDLLFGVGVGFFDRLMLGMSFGLQRFIGRGGIELNERPGLQARLRVIEERYANPALAVGVETQGGGRWFRDDQRYERKSHGLYAVLSKNYYLLRHVALHGGANYSFENRDETGIDLFAGLSIEVVTGMRLLLDYDAALDDNAAGVSTARTRGKGYFDTGVRFDPSDNLSIRFLLKDLGGNYRPESGVARSLEIIYINWF